MEPFVPALQEIVSLAMEVVETSIEALASRAGACSEIITNVQSVGRVWDEHPEWPGRGWYVRLLLAVAGLSRVVEWWEAEKGFWNFEDENELQAGDAIRFILGEGGDASHATAQESTTAAPNSLHSPVRVRGIALPPSSEYSSGTSSPALDPTVSRRVFSESDRSRLVAAQLAQEEAIEEQTLGQSKEQTTAILEAVPESSNVLIELSLDDERLLYVSPAWRSIVG